MSNHRTHSPKFKARVAKEAISCLKTPREIAADDAKHMIQVSQWKKQLLKGANELPRREIILTPKEATGQRPREVTGTDG